MRYAIVIVTVAAMACGAHADESAAWKLVEQGNAALTAGDHDAALQAYDQADGLLPDSPPIRYNKGLAHYRKGEFDKARDLFNEALSTRDLELEAAAHFNLGNCAYSQALAKQQNFDEAINLATQAIGSYRRTLELTPDDRDAKANIETARLFIKHLEDQKKNQQEQQKKQKDQQNKQPQSQPSSQPQSQPSSRPKQQDQKKDPSEDDRQDKQKQQQEQQQGQDQQQKEQDQKEQRGQDQQKQDQQAQQAAAKQGKLSRDEAERLLQSIRDKERQRRRAVVRRQRGIRVPVERDW